jgi:hypothetical protein
VGPLTHQLSSLHFRRPPSPNLPTSASLTTPPPHQLHHRICTCIRSSLHQHQNSRAPRPSQSTTHQRLSRAAVCLPLHYLWQPQFTILANLHKASESAQWGVTLHATEIDHQGGRQRTQVEAAALLYESGLLITQSPGGLGSLPSSWQGVLKVSCFTLLHT